MSNSFKKKNVRKDSNLEPAASASADYQLMEETAYMHHHLWQFNPSDPPSATKKSLGRKKKLFL